ncbi:protein phosphatase 1 regulatory subunit 3B-like [Exaiptasia diaphana]|uniref:CBM21 domain-containing protein n=1 Tax=Exaiptasia diaphana TaxID=2652724 RepID=A0A913XWH1_EXADI|nr:protein phosphatase 1 regulatory subunit 3B-like [Exaiptasia diaphana]
MPASKTLKSSLLGAAKSDTCLNESRRDKKVHFADTLGLSLVSVLHFSDPPRSHNLRKVGIRPASCRGCGRIDRARVLNFVNPLSGKKLLEALERQAVCLESITIREYSIQGNIKVKNLAYEKRLFIRYTKDNWATYQETAASYVYGSSTGSVDTFKFELAISEDLEKDIKIEFAICYQVLGTRIWDNNCGDNYRLIWYGSQKLLKSRDVLDIFQSSRYAGFWI